MTMAYPCPGCGAHLQPVDGPVHAYMASSPACFGAFNLVIAAEYSDPALMAAHRLSVDAYAVQHPGSAEDRRCVQSVGLHLARLGVQLDSFMRPKDINDLMVRFSGHKASLVWLDPPSTFRKTIADVVEFTGSKRHEGAVRDWALSTWQDWSAHHDTIRQWVAEHAR